MPGIGGGGQQMDQPNNKNKIKKIKIIQQTTIIIIIIIITIIAIVTTIINHIRICQGSFLLRSILFLTTRTTIKRERVRERKWNIDSGSCNLSFV